MDKLCILLLVGLFLFKFLVYSQCCPEDQKQTLLQFKFSLYSFFPISNSSSSFDSSMVELNTWNSSSDCCNWDRVTCNSLSHSPSHSRVVVGLHFHSLLSKANGVVTPNVLTPLFRIKSLMLLDISSNYIDGLIPGNGFANLTKLVYLDMSYNFFNGSIPPQLFHLTFLRYLHLRWNSLGRNIPLEVGNLTKLQRLSLCGNKFSGEIPFSILELKELQVFELGSNTLSGQVLSEIGNLSKITILGFGNNDFIGTIPPSIQNLSKLESLYLHNNMLRGEIPSRLFNFKVLKNLFLGGKRDSLTWKNNTKITPKFMLSELKLKSCGLIGEIPKWISTQKGLEFLNLSGNALEGTFLLWLAEMQISKIVLSANKLTGSIPPRLFQSQSLSYLVLSNNNFFGELPENIDDATNIVILMLDGNNFFGPIPNSISNNYALRFLDLSRNRFSGNTFPVFKPNASTWYIDFSYNEFSGKIPVAFPRGTMFIALGNNKFSGSLPHNLIDFNKLRYLYLNDNKITGKFPKFFSKISSLQVLNLRNNCFQGSIGTNNNFSNLRILDFSNNRFTGSIPIEFGNLFAMMETYNDTFSCNDPFGHFLLEFSELIVTWKKSTQSLSFNRINIFTLLDLSNNQLSGEIPTSLGHLKGLKQLNISHNRLSGYIPSNLDGLENVERLDLSHNRLSGSIPQSFVKLQQLGTFNVSNNKLRGKIPVGGQMDTMNDPDYFANNNKLCGMQIRVACSNELSPPETQGDAIENTKNPWFLWEGVWVGLPFGFFSSIGTVFSTGYTALMPLSNRRCLRRRQRFVQNTEVHG